MSYDADDLCMYMKSYDETKRSESEEESWAEDRKQK